MGSLNTCLLNDSMSLTKIVGTAEKNVTVLDTGRVRPRVRPRVEIRRRVRPRFEIRRTFTIRER